MSDNKSAKVRLDKWLWAARFFKTRALAKAAVEGGKVLYDGQRCKVSRTVDLGATLQIRTGFDEKTVTVLKISEHRGGAPVAQLLYEEAEHSIEKREQNAIARKNNSFFAPRPETKPDKKQRRELLKLKSS